MTQTQLMVQGAHSEKPKVRTFMLEELGGDVRALLRNSEFLDLMVGGMSIPSVDELTERVEMCVSTRVRELADERGSRGSDLSSNVTFNNPDNKHPDVAGIPSSTELAEVARNDPITLELLCRLYSQDFHCLGYLCQ